MDRDDIFQETGDRLPIALPSRTLLRDQFRIGRVLGAGGFGVTYLGFDELLERPVAVKEYFPRHLAVDRSENNTIEPRSAVQNDDFDFGLQRFLQEARTLAKFEDHSNIVRVRTFFGENGTGYLVMNYYEGFTLEEYIESQSGWLPEDEALYIIHDVLKGLEAAHDAGVLHRDVDPSNIYLTGDGRVVLLDFGAARTAVGERTQTLSVMLKRGYAPHEQYHSRGEQGPWTDIYATAATLYRTLTGYKPPEAPARVMNEDLVPPIEISPSLSSQVNAAIVAGLEVLPQNRPQTIAEFREMLPDPPGIEAASWIDGNYVSHDHDLDEPDQGDAVVDVTADAACRLYVNGRVSKILEAGEQVTLNLARGSHRLRAVRTDRAASKTGTATLTTSTTSTSGNNGEYVSLRDLIWQSEISASPNSPTAIHVAFGAEAVDDALSEPSSASTSSASTSSAAAWASRKGTKNRNQPEKASDEKASTDSTDGAEPGAESKPDEPYTGDAIPVESREPSSGASKTEEGESSASRPERQRPDRKESRSSRRSESTRSADGDRGMVSAGSRSPSTPSNRVDERKPAGDMSRSEVGTARADGRDDTEAEESDLAVAMHHASKAVKKAVRRALNSATAALSKTREVTATTVRSIASRIQEIDWSSKAPSFDTGTDAAALEETDETSTSRTSITPSGAPSSDSRSASAGLADGKRESLGPAKASPAAASPSEASPSNADPSNTASGDAGVDASAIAANVPVDFSSRTMQGGIAVSVLLLAVIGWWAIAGSGAPAQPTNQAPVLAEDFATTQTDSVVINVTQNDRDPEGRSVRLASVTAPPASVGTVVQLDSARIQFQPAEGFAGVAKIQHTVMDADSSFSQGIARVHVPFPPEPQTVVEASGDPQMLYPADMSSDGLPDLLTTTYTGNEVLLFDNRSGQSVQVMQDADGAIDASSADLDGDGDLDVLAAAFRDDAAYVIQNITQPGQDLAFADPIALPTELKGAYAARPADVDGDGLLDVVAVSKINGTIVWFRNTSATGGFTFAEAQTIVDGLPGIEALALDDIDADGDPDLLTADYRTDVVAWHENTSASDSASFVTHVVDESATGAITVTSADLDSDGLRDMIASTAENDRVVWYRQIPRDSADTSPPRFEAPALISEDVDEPESIAAADVDQDGDLDVLTGSFRSGVVAWHENVGNGSFGTRHIITRDALEVLAVLPLDFDGDGDLDIAIASQGNDTIVWYENAIRSISPGSVSADSVAADSVAADSVAVTASPADSFGTPATQGEAPGAK